MCRCRRWRPPNRGRNDTPKTDQDGSQRGGRVRAVVDYVVDVLDSAALRCALEVVLPDAASLTVYMCWHSGTGHEYPVNVLDAAERLRQRHGEEPGSGCDEQYTSLTFAPSFEDHRDFLEVAPFCDLAYATNPQDELLAEVTGEGTTARVCLPTIVHTDVLAHCPGALLVPVGGRAPRALRFVKGLCARPRKGG